MNHFKVGQKVVAIRSTPHRNKCRVVEGRIYVIRGFGCDCEGEGLGVLLVGLNNKSTEWYCGCVGEAQYNPSYFRPLDEMQEEARKRQQIEEPITKP